MNRRQVKNDLTKKQIMSAAANLFAEQDYESTSVDDIAERANVAKGTFYYHFSSKEDLVVALRVASFENTCEIALNSLDAGEQPIAILERVFLERAAWTEKNPHLAKIFFEQRIHQFLFRENDALAAGMHVDEAKHDSAITKDFSGNGNGHVNGNDNGNETNYGNDNHKKNKKVRFFQLIRELVLAAQKAKELRQDIPPSELTQMIIACFLHAQGSWLGGYSGVSLVDKVHRWLHAILDGLYA